MSEDYSFNAILSKLAQAGRDGGIDSAVDMIRGWITESHQFGIAQERQRCAGLRAF